MCEVTTTSRRTMVALGKMIVFGTWPLAFVMNHVVQLQ